MVAASLVLMTVVVTRVPCNQAEGTVQASSREDRDAGAAVFHEKGCEHCHGAAGIGTEKGPNLSTVGKRRKKEQIEHQIIMGGDQMPAFGSALQPDEVKVLVDFLSAKRKAPTKLP